MGQVAMATSRDSWRTMLTGGARSLIGGRPSGTRVEATTGAWMVRPLHGVPQRAGGVREGQKDSVPFSYILQLKVMSKIL